MGGGDSADARTADSEEEAALAASENDDEEAEKAKLALLVDDGDEVGWRIVNQHVRGNTLVRTCPHGCRAVFLIMQDKHFDMAAIVKNEKLSKKARRRLQKQGKEQKSDNFEINVNDERFKALYESHHFSIDPTNPHYTGTKAAQQYVLLSGEIKVWRDGLFRSPLARNFLLIVLPLALLSLSIRLLEERHKRQKDKAGKKSSAKRAAEESSGAEAALADDTATSAAKQRRKELDQVVNKLKKAKAPGAASV